MCFSKKIFFISLFLFFGIYVSISQITTTNAAPYNTEEYLVNDVLLGADLETSNYSSVGFDAGIGYFDGANSNIGFEEGVILSSGGLEMVTGGFGTGSGVSGEPDLELALNQINLFWNVNNVTVLEFDFVAESETVTFNYVFGSTEYASYTCTQFNDIFGFFLSGPGINGIYSNDAVNLALVPDPNNPGQFTDTPVAVNTLNSGSPTGSGTASTCDNIDPNWASYNVFWIDNQYTGNDWEGVNQPPSPEFTVSGISGFTVPLQATYDGLICGETYHIKLAIGDASDSALNSVVFIEANSFISPSVSVDAIPNFDLAGAEGGILEGCGTVSLEFIRSGDLEGELPVTLSYSGTSTYGVDYENLPTEILLPPNQEQYLLPFDVFYDGLPDDQETLVITVTGLPDACGDVEVQVIEMIIFDQPEIIVDPGECEEINCFGDVAELQPESVLGGVGPPYFYEWQDVTGNIISSNESVVVNPESNSLYTLTVTDECGDQQAGPIQFCVNVSEYAPINIEIPDYTACDNESLILEPSISGGSGDFSYLWSNNGSTTMNNNIVFDLNEGASQQFSLEVIDNCTSESISASAEVNVENTLAPQIITDLEIPICVGMEGLVSVNPVGNSNYTVIWNNIQATDIVNGNEMIVYPQAFLNNYSGVVIDNCNQQETAFQIPLEIMQYSGPSFVVADGEGCEGELLEFNVDDLFTDVPQSFQDFSFDWSTGETNMETFIYVQDEPEQYTVTITDLCGNSNTETFSVSPSIPPPPYFYYEEVEDNIVQFDQFTDEIYDSYVWDFGDDSSFSNEYEPIHTFPGPGEYYVTLTVEDSFGCLSDATIIVHIYPTLYIYPPTIFTPNNDGHNDKFKVSVVGSDEYELIVFDRWGKEVFRSADPEEGWDGNYQNGNAAEQAVYTYKVIVHNGDTGQKIQTGKVTLAK